MMNRLNTQQNSRTSPNQNYARELMELHTLGVTGGYTQQDVIEVARCFTGWRYNTTTNDPNRGTVLLQPERPRHRDQDWCSATRSRATASTRG